MKLAYISPTARLNQISGKGDIFMCLAHLVDNEGTNPYARFHRRKAEQGRTIILDNGLFEEAQVDIPTLLLRAGAIKASCVLAPDVLYNSSDTIKSFKQFIRAKQDKGLVFDVMGVPQADNPTDWWNCFRFMDLSPDCNVIGLSILSIPRAFNEFLGTTGITAARLHIIRQLYHYEILLGRRLTRCHLLGLGDSLADLLYSHRNLPGTIVSNDSSSCYMHGKHLVKYSQLGQIPGGKILEKVDFDIDENLTKEQEEMIRWNMQVTYNLTH